MVKSTLRRPLAAFILTMVLTASSATAAVSPGGSLWEGWGHAAWSWVAEAVGLGKHGCDISPDGTTRCAPVTPKHGCEIGPDGKPGCMPVTPKHGCDINPDGKPRCTP